MNNVIITISTGRPVHGTLSQDIIDKERKVTSQGNTTMDWVTMPNVSRENWDSEYYKNVTEEDIRDCIDVDDIFSQYKFEVEENHCDLYFWGIKK